MKKKYVLVVALLAVALFLRGLHFQKIVIGFDQVQIFENVHAILMGDFTLIGPRTGPASMFTGPLIYYLSLPFIAVFGELKSLVFISLTISLITGSIAYGLMQKYLGTPIALIGLLLWSVSPLIVHLDRTVWNPSLSILAASLLFFPLLSKKTAKIDFISLFVGAFLSYQAHFSGFLMVGSALITIIVLQKSWRLYLPIVLGLLLSVLPTIVFDIRNNFLNLNGFLQLLSGNAENISSISTSNQFLHTLNSIFQFIGMFFFSIRQHFVYTVFGLLYLIFLIYSARKNKNLLPSIIWIVVVIMCYSFYKGEQPEYYFLLLIPPIVSSAATFLSKMNTIPTMLILVSISAISIFTTLRASPFSENLTIDVLSRIHTQLRNQKIKSITYDIAPGQDFGVRYILKNIPLTNDGEHIHITYPNEYSFEGMNHYGNVGVWIDPRIEDKNYLTTHSYILAYGKSFTLDTAYSDHYLLKKNAQLIGTLSVVKQPCTEKNFQQKESWISEQKNTFILDRVNHCLRFESTIVNPEIAELFLY
ncbi:MAG: hypothetical protein KBD46_03725 [Candidatus Levybacteria bacterium]|nr:hypothetical protein [Candidatus Levybacteria bacterium]